MSSVHPNILAQVDYERSFLTSQQKGARRVKLDRGKTWLIRFLPARLGPNQTWFARIARHWLSMRPIVCPRYTAPDFGGDPEAECACCDVAAELNDSADQEVSKFGFKVMGNPQWLTFCIVFEKDGDQMNMAEVLNPYEFNHYRGTFEELLNIYKAGIRRSPLSILDYKTGNDFVIMKTGKGMKLDKQDAAPIFDLKDPNFESNIAKIEAAIKLPKITIPTADQLYTFSLKIQEFAEKIQKGGESDAPRRSRRSAQDYDDGMDDNPNADASEGYRESDEEAPVRRSSPRAARPAPAAEPAPARRAPRPAPESEDESNSELMPQRPAARTASTARRPAPEPEPESGAEPEEPSEEPAPPPPARRQSQPARAAYQTPASRRAAAAADSAGAAAETGGAYPDEGAEEEQLPEEPNDHAPASEDAMPEDEGAQEPPPVTRRGGMGDKIRNKIESMSKRGA